MFDDQVGYERATYYAVPSSALRSALRPMVDAWAVSSWRCFVRAGSTRWRLMTTRPAALSLGYDDRVVVDRLDLDVLDDRVMAIVGTPTCLEARGCLRPVRGPRQRRLL